MGDQGVGSNEGGDREGPRESHEIMEDNGDDLFDAEDPENPQIKVAKGPSSPTLEEREAHNACTTYFHCMCVCVH